MKAFIVNKSRLMRSVLRHLCEERGFAVKEAGSHQKATELIRAASPDLILTEETTCDHETLDFLRTCRNEAPRQAVIVVVGLPEASDAERQSAAIAGADFFLPKPFSAIQLDYILQLSGLEKRSCISACSSTDGVLSSMLTINSKSCIQLWEGCCV